MYVSNWRGLAQGASQLTAGAKCAIVLLSPHAKMKNMRQYSPTNATETALQEKKGSARHIDVLLNSPEKLQKLDDSREVGEVFPNPQAPRFIVPVEQPLLREIASIFIVCSKDTHPWLFGLMIYLNLLFKLMMKLI